MPIPIFTPRNFIKFDEKFRENASNCTKTICWTFLFQKYAMANFEAFY